MFVLDDKTYLWLFWIIPIVVLLFLMTRLWRRRAQLKFAHPEALHKLSPDKSRFKPILKLIFFCLALACFVMALVNPKIGTKTETVKRKGVDIVFAIDVSKSMLAEDIAPNRLEKAKRITQQIIEHLQGDRIGIIAYAGAAVPQLPITTDYSAARLFLDNLNTNMISSGGTAIAEAINYSLDYFNDNSKIGRVLILLTDGEDHQGEIKAILSEADQKDIHIITIGIGTTRGGRIPIKENGVVRYYQKDRSGETVITKLDPSTLKTIAQATKGKYIYGAKTKETVDAVESFLGNLEKSEFKSQQLTNFKSQFQWFLGFGILFTILELLLLERKTSWVKRLNLFNENKNNTNDAN